MVRWLGPVTSEGFCVGVTSPDRPCRSNLLIAPRHGSRRDAATAEAKSAAGPDIFLVPPQYRHIFTSSPLGIAVDKPPREAARMDSTHIIRSGRFDAPYACV